MLWHPKLENEWQIEKPKWKTTLLIESLMMLLKIGAQASMMPEWRMVALMMILLEWKAAAQTVILESRTAAQMMMADW